MKIEVKPPRLVCLRLGVIDPETRKLTGLRFNIKYHDMPHVVDFVILRQFYERAVAVDWRPRDRFRCIIDDFWYLGTIDATKPFKEEYPDSPFQCLQVTWDSKDVELLSPWDVEQVTNGKRSKGTATVAEGAPVTSDELKTLLYKADSDEWPSDGRDVECERILRGLQRIMELSIAELFNYPVDLETFPTYPILIAYPIDLNTIRERIENRYYRRVNSIQWDVRYIESNACEFNEPNTEIVKNAILLTELLLEFISDTDCTNPIPIYKRLCQNRTVRTRARSEETEMDMANGGARATRSKIKQDTASSDSDEDNSNSKAFKKRKGVSKKNTLRDTKAPARAEQVMSAWRKDCLNLIDNLIGHTDSEPFRLPVDLKDYPDYLETVETPVDLKTIRDRLLNNEYHNDINKFDADCKLLFKNSKTYNTHKRSKVIFVVVSPNSSLAF